jgi:hypothetical protein
VHVAGRLQVTVDGQVWHPVTTLAACGPADSCYVVRVDDDGALEIAFGDGTTGRRPPDGARIGVTYRGGAGDSGDGGAGGSNDPIATLVEAWAEVADVLSRYQDQVSSEAYLAGETERISGVDAAGLRRAIAERDPGIRLCLCLRPVRPGTGRAEA